MQKAERRFVTFCCPAPIQISLHPGAAHSSHPRRCAAKSSPISGVFCKARESCSPLLSPLCLHASVSPRRCVQRRFHHTDRFQTDLKYKFSNHPRISSKWGLIWVNPHIDVSHKPAYPVLVGGKLCWAEVCVQCESNRAHGLSLHAAQQAPLVVPAFLFILYHSPLCFPRASSSSLASLAAPLC